MSTNSKKNHWDKNTDTEILEWQKTHNKKLERILINKLYSLIRFIWYEKKYLRGYFPDLDDIINIIAGEVWKAIEKYPGRGSSYSYIFRSILNRFYQNFKYKNTNKYKNTPPVYPLKTGYNFSEEESCHLAVEDYNIENVNYDIYDSAIKFFSKREPRQAERIKIFFDYLSCHGSVILRSDKQELYKMLDMTDTQFLYFMSKLRKYKNSFIKHIL